MPKIKDLTSKERYMTLANFSIPIFFSLMLQLFYQIIDMIFVGKFIGSAGITAVSNVSGIVWIITAFTNGLSVGGTILISQYEGARNTNRQNQTLSTLCTTIFYIGIIFTALTLLFYKEILFPLNIPKESEIYANEFFFVLSTGWFFMFGFNAICDVMRGFGNSAHPFYAMVISTIVNIILDFLFVKFLNMGTKGVALSTVIAEGIAFLYALVTLKKVHFKKKKLKLFGINGDILRTLLKLGLPTAVQMIVLNLSYFLMTVMLNFYGVVVAASAGIGFKISSFMTTPLWAIGRAVAIMVGQNIGAKKINQAKKVVIAGLKVNLIITTLVVLIFQIFAKQIVALFDTNIEVVANGITFIRIVCSFGLILYAIMFTFDLFATGVGHTTFALMNSLTESIIMRIPLCLTFSYLFGLGFEGIYFGEAFSPLVSAIIGILYFRREKWKNVKLMETK